MSRVLSASSLEGCSGSLRRFCGSAPHRVDMRWGAHFIGSLGQVRRIKFDVGNAIQSK
jgi:hypothetical protein